MLSPGNSTGLKCSSNPRKIRNSITEQYKSNVGLLQGGGENNSILGNLLLRRPQKQTAFPTWPPDVTINWNVGIKIISGNHGNFLTDQKPPVIRHFKNGVYKVCTQIFTLHFPRRSIAIFIICFHIGFLSGCLEHLTANSTSQPFNRRKWNGVSLSVILSSSSPTIQSHFPRSKRVSFSEKYKLVNFVFFFYFNKSLTNSTKARSITF